MKTKIVAVLGSSFTTRVVLFFSGLIAVAIAVTILFAPDAFYAGYGIEVGGNATLANELKAPAGALLITGLLMFMGVFRGGVSSRFADDGDDRVLILWGGPGHEYGHRRHAP